MRNSLYYRIVWTFILVVLISLIVSYLFSPILSRDEIIEESGLHELADELIELVDNMEDEQLITLNQLFKRMNIDFLLINKQGEAVYHTEPTFPISEETLAQLFESSSNSNGYILHEDNEVARIYGTVITINGEEIGLLTHVNYEDEINALKRIIYTSLLVVLITGSLLILFASRYLVNPLKELTAAAKKISMGNFSVRLENSRKDEIGELITSFNHMASEVGKIDQMREDFVTNVSHEIQSPLTSIKGFTKALKDDMVPEDQQKEYLEVIYQEADRLSRLGDNLLRLASLESEHHPFNPIQYKLDEQIRRNVLGTEPLWREKDIKVRLNLQPIEVYADRDLFDQVWLNLLSNAIKYSYDGGKINIDLKEVDGKIQVSVTDHGQGIELEDLPYLFDRFYKGDKARRNSIKGNGLGLSIVKKILDIHGYSLLVESNKKGTKFTVEIPIAKRTFSQ